MGNMIEKCKNNELSSVGFCGQYFLFPEYGFWKLHPRCCGYSIYLFKD